MKLLLLVAVCLSVAEFTNAVCTRFPLKVEREADGKLKSFCEYKAPNSATGVKIIRGLKIQSQKCISCECTSMGLICCREDKPDLSTVPEGCMVVPDRCGFKMVLIQDKNVECMPLHMLGGTSAPPQHHMPPMEMYARGSGSPSKVSLPTIQPVKKATVNHATSHGGKGTGSVYDSGSSKTPSISSKTSDMADLAAQLSKLSHTQHQQHHTMPLTKPKTGISKTPKAAPTTSKPQSVFDLMAMQSFMDRGGLNAIGGLEGLARMNAIGLSPLGMDKTSAGPSSGQSNALSDMMAMQTVMESGGIGGFAASMPPGLLSMGLMG